MVWKPLRNAGSVAFAHAQRRFNTSFLFHLFQQVAAFGIAKLRVLAQRIANCIPHFKPLLCLRPSESSIQCPQKGRRAIIRRARLVAVLNRRVRPFMPGGTGFLEPCEDCFGLWLFHFSENALQSAAPDSVSRTRFPDVSAKPLLTSEMPLCRFAKVALCTSTSLSTQCVGLPFSIALFQMWQAVISASRLPMPRC